MGPANSSDFQSRDSGSLIKKIMNSRAPLGNLRRVTRFARCPNTGLAENWVDVMTKILWRRSLYSHSLHLPSGLKSPKRVAKRRRQVLPRSTWLKIPGR